jgi:pyruvate dehydrogenase kinase 2/3/4
MVKNAKEKKVGLSIVYPPPHLYQILFELFKNSMRATVETHSKLQRLPEIEVPLAKGEHDVSIRVSDQVLHIDTHLHCMRT